MTGRRGPLIFALPGNETFAFELAQAANVELGMMEVRRFPDGETYARLVTDPADRDVMLVATQHEPDERFLPVAFIADAARDLGATRVGLVAPYLGYLRQDRRFRRGEAVTARSFARLLSQAVDWLVTVDPHLHRMHSLAELYDIPATAVDMASELGCWIAEHIERPLIVGPDAESEQWARVVGTAADAPVVVLHKQRLSPVEVQVRLPDMTGHRGRTPVLVDDIISTGHTVLEAASQMRAAGFPAPACVAVHAVFARGAHEELAQSGVTPIVTTDTIAHVTNRISAVSTLARAIRAASRVGGLLTGGQVKPDCHAVAVGQRYGAFTA